MTTNDAYLPMKKWSRLLNEESNMYQFWNNFAWIWYQWKITKIWRIFND